MRSFVFSEDGFGLLVHEQDQLRPSTGEVEPVRVLCVLGRNGCLQALDELAQATRPVLDWIGSNADAYPGLGQGVCMVVGHGVQQSLDEQVVDVDPDVMVIERQIDRSLNGQTVGLLCLHRTPDAPLAASRSRKIGQRSWRNAKKASRSVTRVSSGQSSKVLFWRRSWMNRSSRTVGMRWPR